MKSVLLILSVFAAIVGYTSAAPPVLVHGAPMGTKDVGSLQCDICKIVVKVAEQYAEQNATEEKVKEEVEQFCRSLLPYANECSQLVNEYFDVIWHLVINDETPETVSTQLGLCGTKTQPKLVPASLQCDICKEVVKIVETYAEENATEEELHPTKVDSLQCDLCEEVVKIAEENATEAICYECKLVTVFLKVYLDENKTEEETEKALLDLCDFLPSDNQATCKDLATKYFPVVYSLIRQELDSGDICSIIGLCPKTQPAVSQEITEMHKEEEPEAEEIIQLENNICSALPSTIKGECQDFVNMYGKEIIDALINDVGPNAVCTVIHLCAASVEKDISPNELVDDSRCTWGPTYWCSSHQTAVECNAEEYCRAQKLL